MTGVGRAVLTALLCAPTPGWAHGMEADLLPAEGAVVLACAYSNGDRADAEVLVYSPAEPGRIFQRLRTDLRGVASFVPDAAGTWRIVADDGMGHRVEREIEVSEAGASLPSRRQPAWLGAAVVLVALAVPFAAWLARRRREVSQ